MEAIESTRPVNRKVRTGCLTCKSSESPRRTGNLVIIVAGSPEEQRYFDFFRHKTLPNVNGGFESFFWDKLILQMSASDPAIRHAVVALASIHDESDPTGPLIGSKTNPFSTSQYVKSLSHLQSRMANGEGNSIDIILTCCIIFTAFEAIRGNPSLAMLHLRNGLKMISESNEPSNAQSRLTEIVTEDLMPVFLRLNIQARSLLRPALADSHYLDEAQISTSDIPETFRSLTQARDALSVLFNNGFSIFHSVTQSDTYRYYPSKDFTQVSAVDEEAPISPTFTTDVLHASTCSSIVDKIANLGVQLSQWHAAYDRLLQILTSRNHKETLTGSDLHGATLLRIHQISAQIVIATCMDTSNLAFDDWTASFDQLVTLARDLISLAGWDKNPSFSVDMGVIAPLYFTVTSCRHPRIRREAVSLLKSMNSRREGAWYARVAAGVGEWFIAVEEGHALPDSGVWLSAAGFMGEDAEEGGGAAFDGIRVNDVKVQGYGFGALGTVTHSKPVSMGKFGCWISGRPRQGDVRKVDGLGNGLGLRVPQGFEGGMEQVRAENGGVVRRIRRLHAEVHEEEKWVKLVPMFHDEEEMEEPEEQAITVTLTTWGPLLPIDLPASQQRTLSRHKYTVSVPQSFCPLPLILYMYKKSMLNPVESVKNLPENPYAALIPNQHIATVPFFTLESGDTLRNVPVAYSTNGRLNAARDNVIIICHALSGSADVADWWGPLIGVRGKAFDLSRFFVVCLNSLGSPYGTASPLTYVDGDPVKGRYGPEFPLTTIKDDVNLHRIVLDQLGVRQIAAAVGGSMGGMLVLEYAYFGKDYVRAIVPIATSSQHSAWGISWGESQRQSIYADPKYEDGYYSFDDPPVAGLSAARMQALLTYRSRNSFETRFGRNIPNQSQIAKSVGRPDSLSRSDSNSNPHFAIHNDGHKICGSSRSHASTPPSTPPPEPPILNTPEYTDPQFHGTKFVSRFDSNCYIAITRKLDTHDISSHASPPSASSPPLSPKEKVKAALAQIQQPALVLGIESDGLFTFAEQQEIADGIKDSRLKKIESPEGHDAFLLQFKQVNAFVLEFFWEVLPNLMGAEVGGEGDGVNEKGMNGVRAGGEGEGQENGNMEMKKASVFGEAEGDITAW
ncbi:uncharacterized protein KY384_000433 [Bacidia gigantensis]|uniref:uncharacterized protein n=1 Tax=Bacidia gigantensis TaxID=2732470 RepID=UPI001D045616|nr:uncharacterized protein KY384_000433 [Bacidia gigantensis]KAG8525673.1 hypothetical protein KY384_000433 [Bacidia gigantensis]